MTEQLKQKLNDSKVLRWSVLALVAFTMLCGYFLTDVMSPLKPMLEKELLWDSLDYGFFTSAYGWFNVFLLMLIFGGIILDKMGVRFTGMGACLLMVFGCGLKYYAVSTTFPEGAHLDIEMAVLFILHMNIQNDARIQIGIEHGAFLYPNSGNTFNDGVAGVHRAFILTGKGVLKK